MKVDELEGVLSDCHPLVRAWKQRVSEGHAKDDALPDDLEKAVGQELSARWHAIRAFVLFALLQERPISDSQRAAVGTMLTTLKTLIDDKAACGMRCGVKDGIRLCDTAAEVAFIFATKGRKAAADMADRMLERALKRKAEEDSKAEEVVPTRGKSKPHNFAPTARSAAAFIRRLDPKNRAECAANQRDQLRELCVVLKEGGN